MATRKIMSLPHQGGRNAERGVTLTELSVSVTIIALMVAATFAGITIVKAAKTRKAATELTQTMSAINEFQTQYGYLPGDLPLASSYWSGAHNGSGDGIVTSTAEDLLVWEHLGNAKLIAGTYPGTVAGTYVAGTNAPTSEPYTSGVFSFYAYQSLIYNTRGHALALGSIVSGMPTGGVMLAKDAYSIDVKLDDGLASSGMFYITSGVAGNCVSALKSAATATYVLSDVTNSDCQLFYWQKKF